MTANVVNTWQSSTASSYTYGSIQVPVANSQGNWLFAIAQWETTEDLAVVYCTDDAHNFWQPVICTTSTTAAVRTAILLVQNASAASTVYFASTGFIRNAMYTVIEVTGLQSGYVLDVTGSVTSAGATSISLSPTLTQADFVLGSAVQDTTANTITFTAGWTGISGGNNTTLQNSMQWKTAGAGAQTLTWTNSGATSAPWAGVMVAVASAAAMPQNANPNWPVISCQAAFGFLAGDGSLYPSWTDITPRFLGLQGQRGRQFELDQLEAADVTITLDNFDGAFNPLNTTGPYYPNVNLITPVRLLATWQGRTYQVFSGHIEYIPQTYDFERGLVQVECSDAFAKLPQVLLQACMQQEILYDKPWHYWPLNDPQGANFASNHSGRAEDTMQAANIRGGAVSNAFGTTVSPTFKGAQDTCWSVTGAFSSVSNTSMRFYRPGGQLPSITNGVTIECWSQISEMPFPAPAPLAIMAVEGNAWTVSGVIAMVALDATTNKPALIWNDSSGNQHTQFLSSLPGTDGQWHHYAVQMTSTTYRAYLDGALAVSGSWTLIGTTPNLFEVGALTNRFGPYSVASSSPVNFAHVVYYDSIVDPERIASHAQSGFGGFQGEFLGQRIMRLLTYVRWNKPQAIDGGNTTAQRLDYLNVGGYGTSAIRGASGLFGSYGTAPSSGSQADLAVVDVAASENGLLLVDKNGALVFRARNHLYDPVLRCSFGDSFIPMNANPYFKGGSLANWTAGNSASIASGTSTWSYSGIGSLLFHGDGVTANPLVRSENTLPVTVGTSYTGNAWVYSPQGFGSVKVSINWYDNTFTLLSTTNGTLTNVNPVTPVFLSVTGTAPASAAFAAILVTMTGTPASSVQLVIDRAPLSVAGFQVPYQDDIQIDYDVTYLYNDVALTRNVDQAIIHLIDQGSQKQYYPRSYSRTVYTTGDNPPVEVIHAAEWLLKAYAQPTVRISRMTVDAASNPDAWPFVLATDVGDTVTVTRDPVGAPAIATNYMVIGIDPALGQDEATYVYSLAPILVPVLTLDNPVFGTLAGNSLGW